MGKVSWEETEGKRRYQYRVLIMEDELHYVPDLLLRILAQRHGILTSLKVWRNGYFVEVLPSETCTGFAQAGDGFAIRFPVVSKLRLSKIISLLTLLRWPFEFH